MEDQIRDSKGEIRLASVDFNGNVVFVVPGRWECLRCGGDFVSELSPPFFCSCCNRKATFKSVTSPVFREEWLSYGEPVIYGELDGLFQEVCGFIKDHLVLRSDAEYMVLALWVIASYKREFLDAVPYLQFLGTIESGKTRALEVLKLLAYRAIKVSSISPSSLCRVLELFHPTILLDQAEQKFNLKFERGNEMYDIFMCGYIKGDRHIVASKENETEVVSRNVFGFKAVASTRVFDDAFASRSIQFRMQQNVPNTKDIRRPSRVKAEEIRNKLLYYHLKEDELSEVDIPLTGRRRELFLPLFAVGKDFGVDWDDLKEYIESDKKKLEDEQRNSPEGSVLQMIKRFYHGIDEQESLRTAEIAQELDIKPNSLGYLLRNMNIPRKRCGKGMYIDFTDKKTQDELQCLFVKYKLEA